MNVKRKNDDMVCVFKNEDTEYFINYSELSAGQKRLCIYYYLLYTLKEGSVFLIDELENHLSPSELNPLYNLMLTRSDEKNVQFILVSHNPRLLNWYQNDAVLFDAVGTPAIVRTERHDPKETNISLYDRIENE
jgi:predicted ATPase